MKIVINNCYGGFGLSKEAEDYLGLEHYLYSFDDNRHDPKLVEVVEKLGKRANSDYSELEIVEGMPGYKIFDFDGIEYLYYEYNHCVHCDSANIEGSRFCSQCGAPIVPGEYEKSIQVPLETRCKVTRA